MHFVIIGGGPAGTQAATYAARLGVDVTLIERDVIGGAADMWDCIPSKAMIATGGAMAFLDRSFEMGLSPVRPLLADDQVIPDRGDAGDQVIPDPPDHGIPDLVLRIGAKLSSSIPDEGEEP